MLLYKVSCDIQYSLHSPDRFALSHLISATIRKDLKELNSIMGGEVFKRKYANFVHSNWHWKGCRGGPAYIASGVDSNLRMLLKSFKCH